MDVTSIELISLSSALTVGILVGIERTHRASKEEELKGAGIRTFSLMSVMGFFTVYFFSDEPLMIMLITTFFSIFFIAIPIFRKKKQSLGLTTSVSLILVLLIGMIFGQGYLFSGLITGGFLLILNSSKKILHRFADVLTRKELTSAVRFLIVVMILLPIFYTLGPVHPLIGPDRVFDPFQALLMVIFVSIISFISYLAMKKVGSSKGLQLSAFIGGFVSSAAATASVSEKSKRMSKGIISSARSIYLSNVSMFIKDYIIISTIGGLVLAFDFTLLLTFLLGINLIFVFFTKKKKKFEESADDDLGLGTPFALLPALKFAFFFSLIWVSSYLLQNYMGDSGVYIVSIGGLLSTTSVSASISSLYATGEIGSLAAISTLLLAFGFGSISKVLIARTYSKELAKKILIPMIILATTSFILVGLLN